MASFLGDLVRGVAESSNQFPDAMRNRLLMQRDEERRTNEESAQQRQEIFRVFNMHQEQYRDNARMIQDDLDALQDQARDAYTAGIEPPPELYAEIERKREERDEIGAQGNDLARRLMDMYPSRGERGTWVSPELPDPANVQMVETEDGDVVQDVEYDPVAMGKVIAEKAKKDEREKLFQKTLIAVKGIATNQGPEAAIQYAEAYLPDMTEQEKVKFQAAFIAPSGTPWTEERLDQAALLIQQSPSGRDLLAGIEDDDARAEILFRIMDQSGKIGRALIGGERKALGQTAAAIHSLEELHKSIEKNQDVLGKYRAAYFEFQESGLGAWTRAEWSEDLLDKWGLGKEAFEEAGILKAEIDKVRQEVGKALEGGVLRKEDEVKYKKILPTLADTPAIALAKIGMMIGGLGRQWRLAAEIQAKYGTGPEVVKSTLYDIVLPIDGGTATFEELDFFITHGWDDVYQPYMEERFPLDPEEE